MESNRKNVPGEMLLKVSGILMIAFFGVMIVITILISWRVSTDLVTPLLTAIFAFVAGIIGVRNCKRKSNACLAWGIVVTVLTVMGLSVALAEADGSWPVDLILLALAVLYLLGAARNQGAAESTMENMATNTTSRTVKKEAKNAAKSAAAAAAKIRKDAARKVAPGRGLLKVMGILLIIGGAAAITGLTVALAIPGARPGSAQAMTAALVILCSEMMFFAAGIVGVVNCGKPKNATICIVWGYIVTGSALVITYCGPMLSDTAGMIGSYAFILAILYVSGAIRNRNAARQAANSRVETNREIAPGRSFLRVVGRIMIAVGTLNLLVGIYGVTSLISQMSKLRIVTSASWLVIGVLRLVAGYAGTRYCDRLEKARTCFTLGIILLAYAIATLILNCTLPGIVWNVMTSVTMIIGFALLTLYLIGAAKNLNAAK